MYRIRVLYLRSLGIFILKRLNFNGDSFIGLGDYLVDGVVGRLLLSGLLVMQSHRLI